MYKHAWLKIRYQGFVGQTGGCIFRLRQAVPGQTLREYATAAALLPATATAPSYGIDVADEDGKTFMLMP
jgi:hypothetical protein